MKDLTVGQWLIEAQVCWFVSSKFSLDEKKIRQR